MRACITFHTLSTQWMARRPVSQIPHSWLAALPRPKFTCPICLEEHLVEAGCTLSCCHRFCLACLQTYCKEQVLLRRLDKLKCPDVSCGRPLTDVEGTLLVEACLSPTSCGNFRQQTITQIPGMVSCSHCSYIGWVDPGEDRRALWCESRRHQFCADCENGPHLGRSCAQRKAELGQEDDRQTLETAWAKNWRPCPRNCKYGGGDKGVDECDHVTCLCGHEYCFQCGADRKAIVCHDNLWHKPSCRYHPRTGVPELRFCRDCPSCREQGMPCQPPEDDGWPLSFRRPSRPATKPMSMRDFLERTSKHDL